MQVDKKNETNSYNELVNEGIKLNDEGKYKEAIKCFKNALIMSREVSSFNLSNLYIRIANAYYKLNDKDKSTYYYEEYLKESPQGQLSVFSRLAHAYYYIDTDKSIDYHNKALNLEINKYNSCNKIFAMTKSSFYEQQDIKEEAEYEAEQLKNTLFKNIKKYNHENKKKNKNRKLNIGYLSSDCYAHTMMNYILPIWENHNKEEFNFFIFNGAEKDDSTTKRITDTGFEIIACSKMEISELAQAIYDKEIDILIDLSGFTHLKSYTAFYKPAPIIISYLGYLNTMGMKEVDYILTDKFTIPEEYAYLYTEKPLYLDKGYQIFTDKKLPHIENAPYKTNNYITFGCFNCTSKINDTVIYMWSKILEKMPNSRLLIYRSQMTRNIIKYLKAKFVKWGVNLDRVFFYSKTYNPHFKAYSLADIALDPYPFSGMSIAIETALMGVPTVTLMGKGMQSRGAARINHVIGLDELNASFGDEYVKIALDLASNKDKLNDLKHNLRDKINNSDLRQNAKDFTRNLEEKYKEAWQNFLQ